LWRGRWNLNGRKEIKDKRESVQHPTKAHTVETCLLYGTWGKSKKLKNITFSYWSELIKILLNFPQGMLHNIRKVGT
jgi:hypothetical protein